MQNEKQQLLIILLIVGIGFIGTSIAYPIFPPLFLHPANNLIIPAGWNEHMKSIFLGIALAVNPLGQFTGSPILGGHPSCGASCVSPFEKLRTNGRNFCHVQ